MNTKLNPDSKIAIITGMGYLDVDRIIAAGVLAKVLANQFQVSVDISLGFSISHETLDKLINLQNIDLIDTISLSQQLLEIEGVDESIDRLEWKQEDAKLKLEMWNANGEKILPSNVSTNLKSSKYNSAYTIGVRSSKYLLRLLTNTSATDLKEVEITSLNTNGEEKPEFATNQIAEDSHNSFCSIVYNYCSKEGLTVSQEQLTELLAGVYWKTNAMRNQYTSQSIIKSASDMVAAGANHKAASERIFASVDKNIHKAWKELTASAEFLEKNDTYVATASSQADYEQIFNNSITPVLTPSFHVKAALSLNLLPIDEENTFVIATSFNKKIDLFEKFKTYNPKGDDIQVKFTYYGNLQQAKQELVKQLDNSNTEPTDNSDKSSKAETEEANNVNPNQSDNRKSGAENTKGISSAGVYPTKSKVISTGSPESNQTQQRDSGGKPEDTSTSNRSHKEVQAKEKEDNASSATATSQEVDQKQNSDTANKPFTTSSSTSNDPLAPAEIDLEEILANSDDEDDDDGNSGSSLFGGFGSSSNKDPLPSAKSNG